MPKTQVKDEATAKAAALTLDVPGTEAPAKPGEPVAERPKSTTEKLFPEFTTDDGLIANRPVKPFSDKDKVLLPEATPAATEPPKASETQPPTNPPLIPTAPVYLKTDELTGKMVKIKVDGVEMDVPAESLTKNYQLERHLNAQLEAVSKLRKEVETEKSQFLAKPPAQTPSETPKTIEKAPQGKKSAEVEALEAQIMAMNQQVQTLVASIQPQIQEAGLKRLDQRVREVFGADDLMTYIPKIKEWAIGEAAKYPDDPQARAFFDSENTWLGKYQELKLRDMVSASKVPPAPPISPATSPAPALIKENGGPVVISNSGKPVSIPNIEGSGGVPSKGNPSGAWLQRAQAAFDQARKTGSTEDWMTYFRIKSEPKD